MSDSEYTAGHGDGLINRASNSDIEAAERAKDAERNPPPILSKLATYIDQCFAEAERHHTEHIRPRLEANDRQVAGEYEADKLKAIQEFGGTELFFNITESKTEGLKAWLSDALMGQPWDLHPTPIPSLSTDLEDMLLQQLLDEYTANPDTSADQVMDLANRLYDDLQNEQFKAAKERCTKMAKKLEDLCIEGGFYDALRDALEDFSKQPVGILKGHVIRNQKRLKWINDEAAGTQCQIIEEPIPTWEALSPYDAFPAPSARNWQEGYFCERIEWDARDIAALRNVPGYSPERIDLVLAQHRLGQIKPPGDHSQTTREDFEDRDSDYSSNTASNTITGISFRGSIPGTHLIDWGKSEHIDPDRYYSIHAVKFGTHVISAILNPDPFGERPIHAASYVKVRNSCWGRSVPEKMADCQEPVNGFSRACLNNGAIASGPMAAVDINACVPECNPTTLRPLKVIQYDGNKSAGKMPVQWFQPGLHAAELMKLIQFWDQQSDDRTGIPRYMYGDQDVGGGGNTATGLSMLMSAASKRLKLVLLNIDRDMIRPAITQLFRWAMLYLPNDQYEHLKGDAQVVPRGVLALLHKEQLQIRRQEFLQLTNNETDMAIIGVKGRAKLLRRVAESLEMDADELIPDEAELLQRSSNAIHDQMPPHTQPLSPEETAILTQAAEQQNTPTSGAAPPVPQEIQ